MVQDYQKYYGSNDGRNVFEVKYIEGDYVSGHLLLQIGKQEGCLIEIQEKEESLIKQWNLSEGKRKAVNSNFNWRKFPNQCQVTMSLTSTKPSSSKLEEITSKTILKRPSSNAKSNNSKKI